MPSRLKSRIHPVQRGCGSALQHRWVQCPFEEAQKLFDRQPMVMETIVATQEGRTTFSIRDLPIRG